MAIPATRILLTTRGTGQVVIRGWLDEIELCRPLVCFDCLRHLAAGVKAIAKHEPGATVFSVLHRQSSVFFCRRVPVLVCYGSIGLFSQVIQFAGRLRRIGGLPRRQSLFPFDQRL